MTRDELASKLTGWRYGEPLNFALAKVAKDNQLLIVSGASDDLCDFDGAISDEFSCYEGGTINSPALPASITANWSPTIQIEGKTVNPSWTYSTILPHSTFLMFENGEIYCVGIVIDLNEVDEIKRKAVEANKDFNGTVKAQEEETLAWYTGYWLKKYDPTTKEVIDVVQPMANGEPCGVVVIKPDTIGEFCGCCDCKGIPLYVNDVVVTSDGLRLKIIRDITRFGLEDKNKNREDDYFKGELTYIGNALDNSSDF